MSDSVQDIRRQRLIDLLNTYKKTGKARSVAELSRRYPVDPSYISQIKTGHRGFGDAAARGLEVALDLPKFYFEPSFSATSVAASEQSLGNAKRLDMSAKVRPVPVLTSLQAVDFKEYCSGSATADRYESIVGGDYSPLVFWVAIEGNSMMPDFVSGELVLIDPTLQPNPADHVAALVDGSDEMVFKKWRPCGFDEKTGKEYAQLISANSDYPVIDSRFAPFTVLGVAIERKQKLR